jgi:hypothetical protein
MRDNKRPLWYTLVKCGLVLPLSVMPFLFAYLAGVDYLLPPHRVHLHHDLLLAGKAVAFGDIGGVVMGLVLGQYMRRLRRASQ